MKRFFWICAVVFVMCTAATMYMASCESTYIKHWEPESVVIKGQFPLVGKLTTTRIHNPTGHGKFKGADEIKYELELYPDNEEGAWAPQVIEFLDKQSEKKPQVNFTNNDNAQLLGSTQINLRKEVSEEKTLYLAHGNFGSPSSFKKATNWTIIWDEQLPLIPIPPVKNVQPGRLQEILRNQQGQTGPVQSVPIPDVKPDQRLVPKVTPNKSPSSKP